MRAYRRSVFALCMAFAPLPSFTGAQEPRITILKIPNVTFKRLKAASDEPHNWLMYSGQLNGQRFSKLDQVNRSNVADLRAKWVHQVPTQAPFEVTPLVVDGIMYVTTPENGAVALDALTGQPYWRYRYEFPNDFKAKFWQINRGFAIHGSRLFMGTMDGKLLALDAGSGRQHWKVHVGNEAEAYFISSAPLVVKDMVITGTGGGDWGIRGYLVAYDVITGEQRWKRYTIPAPGEKHHESWSVDKEHPDAWKTGGAATWLTGAYDAELDLIYWGIGNPAPDYNGEVRRGDNLYSCCMLAIDPDTGEIKWHFQYTPHDIHDWDACQIPILADLPYKGTMRQLLLLANRNGFYYVLDRTNGEFLHAQSYARQDWADRIDENGRPVLIPGKEPTEEGNLVFPDLIGASNWWSPTYSPLTNTYYVMAFDGGGEYFIGEPTYEPGRPFLGTNATATFGVELNPEYKSAVRALDPITGEKKWDYFVEARSTSGLLATQGNILFGGTVNGVFFALDAETGKLLWHFNTGGRIHAAPITYAIEGKQFITIAAGSSLFTFGL